MKTWKIINISNHVLKFPVKVKGKGSMPVVLKGNQFIYTDILEKTRGINFYGKKRLLWIDDETPLPEHLELYVVYNSGAEHQSANKPAEETKRQVVTPTPPKKAEPVVTAAVQDKAAPSAEPVKEEIKKPRESDFLKEIDTLFKGKDKKFNATIDGKEDPTLYDKVEKAVKYYSERVKTEDGKILGPWTDEEIKFLKKNYPKHGRKYCVEQLNRTVHSVQSKVNSLKLRKKKKSNK